jgi:hypothetical protein
MNHKVARSRLARPTPGQKGSPPESEEPMCSSSPSGPLYASRSQLRSCMWSVANRRFVSVIPVEERMSRARSDSR